MHQCCKCLRSSVFINWLGCQSWLAMSPISSDDPPGSSNFCTFWLLFGVEFSGAAKAGGKSRLYFPGSKGFPAQISGNLIALCDGNEAMPKRRWSAIALSGSGFV
ncbi:hypothetical protein CU041_17575 [Thalassospira povalilytica]|uniref:Secreted protein n=1 Tax=Thalassospira povalilytica TaxID=732237 RepID=A0ABX4R591_9PROT|nr:hypothetical protein CU041_17575 [Thalassospira povalilytica]